MEVIKAVKHPNYSNRVKLDVKLDRLRLRPDLRALINSKLNDSFFAGKMTSRAKSSAKIITKINAKGLAKTGLKTGQKQRLDLGLFLPCAHDRVTVHGPKVLPVRHPGCSPSTLPGFVVQIS